MSTTALLILDGFGIGEKDPKSNAIYAAAESQRQKGAENENKNVRR